MLLSLYLTEQRGMSVRTFHPLGVDTLVDDSHPAIVNLDGLPASWPAKEYAFRSGCCLILIVQIHTTERQESAETTFYHGRAWKHFNCLSFDERVSTRADNNIETVLLFLTIRLPKSKSEKAIGKLARPDLIHYLVQRTLPEPRRSMHY